MNFKIVYRCCKYFLLCGLIAGLGLFALVYWFIAAERDISFVNPYIESALTLPQAEISAQIGSSRLRWSSWQQPAVVELRDVKLLKRQADFLEVPRAKATFNLVDSLFDEVVIHQVTFDSLDATLVRRQSGEWVIVGMEGRGLPVKALLNNDHAKDQRATHIEGIAVTSSALMVYDESSDVSLRTEALEAEWVETKPNQHRVRGEVALRIGERRMQAALTLKLDAVEESGGLVLNMTQANPAALCELVMACAERPVLDMPLSGRIGLKLASGYAPENVLFSLSGESGSFTFKPHFPDTLQLDRFAIRGKLLPPEQTLHIEHLEAVLDETAVEASGDVTMKAAGYQIKLDARAIRMPVEDLYKYWPVGLAPNSREWATTAIKDGMATEADISIILQPEDFESPYFPDTFLNSSIKVEGATVTYLPNFPPAREVDAMVVFTGTTMAANIHRGTVLEETEIKQADILFSDLNRAGAPVEIDLSLASSASDIKTFIQPPRFDFLSRLPVDLSPVTGEAEADISLTFDAFRDDNAGQAVIDWDRVAYDIEARLDYVNHLNYREAFTLKRGDGTFTASNDAMALQLNGQVNGRPASIAYDENANSAMNLAFSGTVEDEALYQLGMPQDTPLKGALGVQASISQSARGKPALDARFDLAEASYRMPLIGYHKPRGQAASLSIVSEAEVPGWLLTYESDALSTKGTVVADLDKQALESVTLDRFTYGRHDLAMRYAIRQDGDYLTLKGQALDLVPFMAGREDGKRTISGFPRMRLDLDLERVYLPQEQELRNLTGHVDCTGRRCRSADITATFKEAGSMLMKIAYEDNRRYFHLHSDRAGNLLRTLDIVEEMYGGVLEVRGEYDDGKLGNPLVGRIILQDFVLKKAPILSRILNLSSLTGMLDTLQGEGIAFSRMKSDFVFLNDKLEIKDGRWVGPSLGVIMDGTANIATGVIDVSGNLAPAYALNTFVSRIPVFGELLAGGRGEGIFAVNFSVSGDYGDPVVGANPLSVLTPGFTRKFFEMFENNKAAGESAPGRAEPSGELN